MEHNCIVIYANKCASLTLVLWLSLALSLNFLSPLLSRPSLSLSLSLPFLPFHLRCCSFVDFSRFGALTILVATLHHSPNSCSLFPSPPTVVYPLEAGRQTTPCDPTPAGAGSWELAHCKAAFWRLNSYLLPSFSLLLLLLLLLHLVAPAEHVETFRATFRLAPVWHKRTNTSAKGTTSSSDNYSSSNDDDNNKQIPWWKSILSQLASVVLNSSGLKWRQLSSLLDHLVAILFLL